MPRFDAPTNQPSVAIIEEEEEEEQSTIVVIKKKPKNFSDKYNKGKQIGKGPFGHVYTCWLREEVPHQGGIMGDDEDRSHG